jgi:hypothetical protein
MTKVSFDAAPVSFAKIVPLRYTVSLMTVTHMTKRDT